MRSRTGITTRAGLCATFRSGEPPAAGSPRSCARHETTDRAPPEPRPSGSGCQKARRMSQATATEGPEENLRRRARQASSGWRSRLSIPRRRRIKPGGAGRRRSHRRLRQRSRAVQLCRCARVQAIRREDARVRLERLKGRASFITHERSVEETRNYIEQTGSLSLTRRQASSHRSRFMRSRTGITTRAGLCATFRSGEPPAAGSPRSCARHEPRTTTDRACRSAPRWRAPDGRPARAPGAATVRERLPESATDVASSSNRSLTVAAPGRLSASPGVRP